MSQTLDAIILDDQPGSENVDSGYREMALDEAREVEALELSEGTIGDVSHDYVRGLVSQDI